MRWPCWAPETLSGIFPSVVHDFHDAAPAFSLASEAPQPGLLQQLWLPGRSEGTRGACVAAIRPSTLLLLGKKGGGLQIHCPGNLGTERPLTSPDPAWTVWLHPMRLASREGQAAAGEAAAEAQAAAGERGQCWALQRLPRPSSWGSLGPWEPLGTADPPRECQLGAWHKGWGLMSGQLLHVQVSCFGVPWCGHQLERP